MRLFWPREIKAGGWMKHQISLDLLLTNLHIYRHYRTWCWVARWYQKQLKCFPLSEELWFGWRYLLCWGVSCGLADGQPVGPRQNASLESLEALEWNPGGSPHFQGTCGWRGGMGAFLYHHLPARLHQLEWGRACGFHNLLQLLELHHFHPFWGNVGLLQPILHLHLQSLLPGHWWRTLSYSVAFLRLHRRRRGCQSLLPHLDQIPLRSLSRLAGPLACCPHDHHQNHSYFRQICRDRGRRWNWRGVSQMTHTGQTCRREEEGWQRTAESRGGRDYSQVWNFPPAFPSPPWPRFLFCFLPISETMFDQKRVILINLTIWSR